MLYIDKKYLTILSSRFDAFKWKSNSIANCRCPICGDSKKKRSKMRGYWYPRGDSYWYSCHNCGLNYSLRNFVKIFDYALYEEYSMETYKETVGVTQTPKKIEEPEFSSSQFTQTKISPYLSAKPLLSLKEDHPAYLYVLGRKIPFERLESLYYVPKFFKWASQWKEELSSIKNDHPRLIIPFKDKSGTDIGFSARCFGPEANKYIMMKFDPDSEVRLQYGMEQIDWTENIYCVEGPIDSMFIKNCVASCNAALHTVECADILIYDNQPRNHEVVSLMQKGVESGKGVVVWPDWFSHKDINEAVMKGEEDIQNLIDEHTYYGLELKLRFSQWRKV